MRKETKIENLKRLELEAEQERLKALEADKRRADELEMKG